MSFFRAAMKRYTTWGWATDGKPVSTVVAEPDYSDLCEAAHHCLKFHDQQYPIPVPSTGIYTCMHTAHPTSP